MKRSISREYYEMGIILSYFEQTVESVFCNCLFMHRHQADKKVPPPHPRDVRFFRMHKLHFLVYKVKHM